MQCPWWICFIIKWKHHIEHFMSQDGLRAHGLDFFCTIAIIDASSRHNSHHCPTLFFSGPYKSPLCLAHYSLSSQNSHGIQSWLEPSELEVMAAHFYVVRDWVPRTKVGLWVRTSEGRRVPVAFKQWPVLWLQLWSPPKGRSTSRWLTNGGGYTSNTAGQTQHHCARFPTSAVTAEPLKVQVPSSLSTVQPPCLEIVGMPLTSSRLPCRMTSFTIPHPHLLWRDGISSAWIPKEVGKCGFGFLLATALGNRSSTSESYCRPWILEVWVSSQHVCEKATHHALEDKVRPAMVVHKEQQQINEKS